MYMFTDFCKRDSPSRKLLIFAYPNSQGLCNFCNEISSMVLLKVIRGTGKLRICVLYSLKIVRYSILKNNNLRTGTLTAFSGVTLISEMDLFLRNGRNGDFFTKWGYKILI